MTHLYERYHQSVRQCCIHILGPSHDAEDLCHEVFLRLLTRPEPLYGQDQCMGWLKRVSTNLCINHLKKQSNRQRLLDVYADDLRPPHFSHMNDIDRASFLAVLKQVDDIIGKTAICRYFLGMTYKEISQTVGGTRPTIQKRLEDFAFAAAQHMGESHHHPAANISP